MLWLQDSCEVFQWPSMPDLNQLIDIESMVIFVGWLLFQLILSLLPTGQLVYGLPLESGERLAYRCNG